MRTRTPRLLAALVTGALLLGACGDDDDAADEPDDTTTSETTEAAPSDDGDDVLDDGPDDDVDDVDDDDGPTPFDPAILAGIDDFCDLDEVGDDAFDALFTDQEATPAQREEAVKALGAFYQRAIDLAPGEIKSDLVLMSEAIGPLFQLLAQYDYDFMALFAAAEADPSLGEQVEAIDSPELNAAGERVDDWVEANCDWE
ncbi:MAG TPA: hypothetical protein VK007_02965 [Acidimicrobiales bacterium]|nr:hypothetical protein [Acidimicrobiales bacterium]